MNLKPSLFNQFHEDQDNDESWAISYGDMITLLLSFFVIFFSADYNKNQIKEKEKVSTKEKIEKLDTHLITALKLGSTSSSSFGSQVDGKNLYPDKNFNKAMEAFKNMKVSKVQDQIVVTFDQLNFFSSAQVNLNKNGEAVMAEFAKTFLPYSSLYRISVKAFTDKRKVTRRHRYKDNLELSALRAIAALRILQKNGIPLNKLEIAGYGEMNKIHTLISPEKIERLSSKELSDISRTIILIIKHDNQMSVI